MDAPKVLANLVALGVSVSLTGRGTLWLDPADVIPADLLDEVRANKTELMALVSSTGAYPTPPPRPLPPANLHRMPEAFRHLGPRHAMLSGEVDPLTGSALWATATSTGTW